ncbi:MAG TPA: PHP domain-containing protein, partial [Terriglobales bacterium]|nr:PHP domain-containing protein [Terriglobales bacterium]
MKDRFEIAADLRQIASLLRIKGENPFKIQAYERGAAALENLEGDLDRVIKGQGLRAIAGIGSGLSAVIEEIHRSGECRLLQQLIDELPPGAVELSEIPGLTLRKIIALNRDLHIESIAELKEACEEGLVSNIKGFGLKSQAKLLNDIESLEKPREHFLLLDAALAESEQILNHLHGCPELVDAGVAGALRRRKETVSQICIVGASKRPQLVVDRFLQYPSLARTEELEADRCLGRLAAGIPVELVIVQPEDYVATLHDRTGSRKHLAKLQGLAATGMTAENNGRQLNRTKGPHPATEAEIYRRLGLPYIPPEIREDEGEIEAAHAGQLPALISAADIRGMTHCHTIYSDGRSSIEEMARAAEALGMAYITITDHSQSAYYARGLSVDQVRAQWDEIARVQERVKIKLLKGTESDILADGALDYPEPLLEQFDIIIASIHTRHKMDSDQMTARLLRAIKAPFFKIWGHPLGRLLGSRPPFFCRMEEVLDGIAQSKAAIEINGDPRRLDLEPRWVRAARERGIKFIVSTDA